MFGELPRELPFAAERDIGFLKYIDFKNPASVEQNDLPFTGGLEFSHVRRATANSHPRRKPLLHAPVFRRANSTPPGRSVRDFHRETSTFRHFDRSQHGFVSALLAAWLRIALRLEAIGPATLLVCSAAHVFRRASLSLVGFAAPRERFVFIVGGRTRATRSYSHYYSFRRHSSPSAGIHVLAGVCELLMSGISPEKVPQIPALAHDADHRRYSSRTVTLAPRLASSRAVVSPIIPAPITTKSEIN